MANSFPLIMWYRRFFISNGDRFNKCSEASSGEQIKVRDNSVAITLVEYIIFVELLFIFKILKTLFQLLGWSGRFVNVTFQEIIAALFEWTWLDILIIPTKNIINNIRIPVYNYVVVTMGVIFFKATFSISSTCDNIAVLWSSPYASWITCRNSFSGKGAVIVCSLFGGIPTVTYE